MGEGTELAVVLIAKDLASETIKGVGEKFHGMGEAGKLAVAGIAAAATAGAAVVTTLITFANGAALKDPSRLFNSSLEGNTRRAIDFHEGEKIDEKALKTLVRAAVTLNKSTAQS